MQMNKNVHLWLILIDMIKVQILIFYSNRKIATIDENRTKVHNIRCALQKTLEDILTVKHKLDIEKFPTKNSVCIVNKRGILTRVELFL